MTTSSHESAPASRSTRALLAALAAVLVLTAVLVPVSGVAARSGTPPRLDQFLWALAQQESGGDYHARNPRSGAYGKYQIMPFNWPAWSRRCIGSARTQPTPRNQEIVARGKVTGLYRWLGTYERVAHWWLTGSNDPNRSHWSVMARRYVSNILSLMRRAPATRARLPRETETTVPGTVHGSGEAPAVVRVTTGWLNFRAAPGVTSRRIGPAIRPGVRLVILATRRIDGGRAWLRVRLPNQRIGWVSARYTRS